MRTKDFFGKPNLNLNTIVLPDIPTWLIDKRVIDLNIFFLCRKNIINDLVRSASWSSGHAFVSGAGGPWFKSRAAQIGQSVANALPSLRHFFERSCVARRRNDVEMGPANSLHASA